jgi:hypothetical protein
MSQFTLGAFEEGQPQPSHFGEFINMVSGRSVVSGGDWSNDRLAGGHGDRLELGLSGDGMVRVFWTPHGLEVNYLSTTNNDEVPPLIIQMVDEDRRLPARLLERRLFGMRQLYALVRLIDTDRIDLLEANLDIRDLEDLLSEDDLLYVECLAPGSWYLTVWAKAQDSYRSILKTVALVYSRGREALLVKLEAEARLKNLEVEEKDFELFTKKLDYSLAISEKLGSDKARKAIEARVMNGLEDFLLRPRDSDEVREASRRLME